MKKTTSLISALLLASNGAWADETVLLEENGFLVFEAETVPAVGDWTSTNQISGFSGTGYYQWSGPTLLNVSKAGRDALLYHFRVTNPGTYELRWRSRIAIGSRSTEHNDSWVRFATGINVAGEEALNGWTKVYMNKRDVWSWDSKTVDFVGKPIRQFFGAGDHTIEISGRSTGHAIDRVVLYRYDDHNFSEDAFNTAAVSRTTQGAVDLVEPVVDVSGPPSEPVQTTEPSAPLEEAPTDADVLPVSLDSCLDGTAVVGAAADLYVQSGRIIENGDLRVEHANRTAYLQFDISEVPEGYESVALQFNVGSDGGSGALDVYSAGHSDWSEQTTDLNNLPSAAVLAGSNNTQWSSGSTQEITLDAAVLSQGQVSLLLELQDGGNDFSVLSSDAGDNAPRLVFTSSNTNFCGDLASLNPEVNLDTGAALDTVAALEPELGAALTGGDISDTSPSSGGGALGLWGAGLLLLLRRRKVAQSSNH